MQVKDLSKEVQLLFTMTDVFMYEGFENLSNVIALQDEIKSKGNDVCAVIAKVFCYEQIIEQMIKSLYVQDILWKRVKNKNIDYHEKNIDKYYTRIKKMDGLIDFQKLNEMKKYCDDFRKIRNLFAHSLVNYKIDELIFNYKDLDELYEEIYEIYSSQNDIFVNRISRKLENATDFLINGKNYLEDISAIREKALRIKGMKNKTQEDIENLANLHQIFWLLKEWNDTGSTGMGLYLKEGLLSFGFYELTPMEVWNFEEEGQDGRHLAQAWDNKQIHVHTVGHDPIRE